MTKKILVISNSSSGFYRLRKELVAALIPDYKITVLAPSTGFENELISMGCSYRKIEYNTHGTNPFSELALIRKYHKLMNEISPDVVLTYAIKPNTYAGIVCQQKKIPYIVNITGLGSALAKKGFLQTISIFLYRKSLRKAHMVFFQNRENLDFLLSRKTLGKHNYMLIPGSGVNLKQYTALEYPKGNDVNFVYVARIIKEKGIDQYLDAAKYFKKQENIHFHVCGACDESYKDIIQDLHQEGIITYHGVVNGLDEIKKIYEMSSCIIHPTYYPEGISNVLLEAAASARPLIATDHAGCREVVDEGVNGYLFKPKNSKQLIERINTFLALSYEQKKQMGINGRHKVENEFNRDIVIREYISAIESAL